MDFFKEFLASSDWQQMRSLLGGATHTDILWVVDSEGSSMQRVDRDYPPVCKLIRGSAKGLSACRSSHSARFQEVKTTSQSVVSSCHFGLLGFALPFMLDDKVIGVAGGCCQQAESPITAEKCAQASTECGIDPEEFAVCAKGVKHISLAEKKRLLSTLSMFTDMASLTMKWMTRLFLALSLEDQYAAKVSSLSEIGWLAASESNWEEMLATITSKTKSMLGVDVCSIYTLNQSHQELVLSATDGLPRTVIGRRVKVGEGIIGRSAQTRSAVVFEQEPEKPTGRRAESARYQSILSVPLIAQDRLIGVIDACTLQARKWTQSDIDFLAIIAGQVAGVVEKSKFRMEMDRELEVAGYIQAKLLPDPIPQISGYDLSAFTVPNKEVSGDYYDFISLGEGRLGIVIADVSGKGIGAAILMANTHGVVRGHARFETKVEDVVSRINNSLYTFTEPDKFVTMFYGILDAKTGKLVYTNAGHNHPFIYRAGNEPLPLDIGGMILGMIEDIKYEEGEVQLAEGDIVVFYSDGVTEARDKNGIFFGEEQLHRIVHEYMEENPSSPNAQTILHRIYEAVCRFSSDVPIADDLTIAVLIRT